MIQAKIVADSLTPNGARLTTLEIVFPRYILAELNTHRLFSKNSASSRAIPFEKMVKQVEENPFIPYAWQKDHKGMQGSDYFTDPFILARINASWIIARDNAIKQAKFLATEGECTEEGVTKQLANRLLEPFMYHKVLISATEWENFFNLRCPRYTFHDEDKDEQDWEFKSRKEAIRVLGADNPAEYPELAVTLGNLSIVQWLELNTGQADIHMMFLAEAIYDVIQESEPKELKEGEWHIPYGDNMAIQTIDNWLINTDYGKTDTRETLQCKISTARCARLSYQTLGDNPEINYEKDLALYETLSTSGHWSPFEHVARVMSGEEYTRYYNNKPDNILLETDNIKSLGWCKNFKGFIQVRELIETKQF